MCFEPIYHKVKLQWWSSNEAHPGQVFIFSLGIILNIFKCFYITLDYTLINRSRSHLRVMTWVISWSSLYELTVWQTRLPHWDCLGLHFWEIKVSKKTWWTAAASFLSPVWFPFLFKSFFLFFQMLLFQYVFEAAYLNLACATIYRCNPPHPHPFQMTKYIVIILISIPYWPLKTLKSKQCK